MARNFIDRCFEAVAPVHAVRRSAARTALQFLNSGYGNYGANLTKKSMRGWEYHGGSSKEDIEDNIDVLRQRSRDAYMGVPVAASALKTLRTNVVAGGLMPAPQIDGAFLGLSAEQTEELHLLASKLMRMIDPNAGETRIGGGAQSVQAAQPTVTLPTDAVSEIQKYKALLDAGVNEMRQWASLRVTCPYSLYDRVRLEAEKLGAVFENTDYGADITLSLLLPEEAAEPFAQTLRELSAGRLVPEKVGSVFRGVLRK